jgi:hypothetical protein
MNRILQFTSMYVKFENEVVLLREYGYKLHYKNCVPEVTVIACASPRTQRHYMSVTTTNNINIVTCISTARQRLGKHIPEEANERNNRTYIARERISKHASLTIETVFSGCSVQSVYKEVFSIIK